MERVARARRERRHDLPPEPAHELVGLVPAAGVAAAAAAGGVDEPLDAYGAPTADALTAAARMLRLERLDPDRVIEWHVAR